MILSEKELERMIGEALGAANPEKAAAHAIAKKLRANEEIVADEAIKRLEILVKQAEKDVVWEGEGTVVHFKAWAKKPPVSWVEFGSALDSDLDVLPLPPGTGTDGERVRITVTKEE